MYETRTTSPDALDENENDTDRVALGVNYFLKGEIGSEDTVDLINL